MSSPSHSSEGASLERSLSDVPAEEFIPGDVAGAASKVAKQQAKARMTLDDVEAFLHSDEVRDDALAIEYPPNFGDITPPDMVDTVNSIMEIVQRYQAGEFFPGQVDEDVVRLSSLFCDLGLQVGYMEGRQHHAEGTVEVTTARYSIKARNYAERHPVSITDATAKALARNAAEEMRAFYGKYHTMWSTFRGLYFAVKDLIQILDHAAGRLHKESRLPQEG